MKEEKTLDLSWSTILKIIFLFIIFYLTFLIREILVLVFFSIILSILFEPLIVFFQKIKIKRFFATLLVYFLFFLLLGIIIYFLTNVLLSEGKKFLEAFPVFFEKINHPLKELGLKSFEKTQSLISLFEKWLLRASENIFSAISAIFGGIFTALTVFTLSIFLSLEEGAVEKFLYLISPSKYQEFTPRLWRIIQKKVVGWFGIRIFLCFLIGFLVYIICYFLDIKYAGIFAFLAGFLDLIPIIGPLLAGFFISVFIFLNFGWPQTILFVVLFIIIQQLEGNLFLPLMTRKLINIPPFVILFSLLVGGKLFGFWGAILAIPFLAIIFELTKEFLKTNKVTSYE